jgi:hypothetical protein
MVYKSEMMNKLNAMVQAIASKADLVEFVRELDANLRLERAEWENPTLEAYLPALASWIEDSDGYYRNKGEMPPASPSWRNVAEMLLAAKVYE